MKEEIFEKKLDCIIYQSTEITELSLKTELDKFNEEDTFFILRYDDEEIEFSSDRFSELVKFLNTVLQDCKLTFPNLFPPTTREGK